MTQPAERLRLWSGITADAELLDAAFAAADPDVAKSYREEGWLDLYGLRHGLAKVLVGDDAWSSDDAAFLAQVAKAAAERGVPFKPPADSVDVGAFDAGGVLAMLDERYDLVVSSDALALVFRENTDLYADVVESGCHDTMVREGISHAVCSHFVGRSWPTYGEGDEGMRAFMAKLEASVQPGLFELSQTPMAKIERAGHRRDRGDADGASALLTEALAEEPNHSGGRVLECDLAIDRGDGEAALASLEIVLKESPAQIRALYRRGRVFAMLDRREEARADLRVVLDALDPRPDEHGNVRRRRIRGVPDDALEVTQALLAKLD